MEREMSYRTEMGLYFSYYKTLVEAPSLVDGIYEMTSDNVTEAGHTINTLQRFNLYPELYLGILFRLFRRFSQWTGNEFQTCFQVRRGNDLPPVMSCEGIGNMHYFYIYAVFAIAGSVLTSVFWMGALLSNSYLGGLLSATAFIANHGHSTRVQWTPPLRESFGYPTFALQLCFLTLILRSKAVNWFAYAGFTFLTLHFILFWQFSGFVLFTQICCLFATHVLNLISNKKVGRLLHLYAFAFVISYIGLFGNAMLLSSLFFTSLLSFYTIVFLDHIICLPNIAILFRIVKICAFLLFTFSLKYVMNNWGGIRDDNHVFDILRSKFTNYSNFHTRLYTCAAEFDFVDFETMQSITFTGLLPLAIVSLLLVVVYGCRLFLMNWIYPTPNEKRPELIFNAGQLLCFSLMGILIMRLKLFAVPHLCIVLPIVFNTNLQIAVFNRKLPWKQASIVLCIALLAFRGQENVQKQMSINGEFSNEMQERLFRWISENTEKDSVFAGSMPLMANLKLTTLRPIFNHPHYEDEGIRSIGNRKHQMAKKLKKLLQTAMQVNARPNRVNYTEYDNVNAPRPCENPNNYEATSSYQQSSDLPNEFVVKPAKSHAEMYSDARAKEQKVVVKEEKIPEKLVRPEHFDDYDSDNGAFMLDDDECGTSKIVQIVKTKKRKVPIKPAVQKKRSRYQRQVSSSESSDSSEDDEEFLKPVKKSYGYEEESFSENYRFHYERLVLAPDANENEQFTIDFDHLNIVEPSIQHEESLPVFDLLLKIQTEFSRGVLIFIDLIFFVHSLRFEDDSLMDQQIFEFVLVQLRV
ncbi:hypothetical protein M3Y96_00794700 [Aphelenchoides besseyi]|nr:hypothetical protein M3Y96_00794700 [Aphelenchoides besseyi]